MAWVNPAQQRLNAGNLAPCIHLWLVGQREPVCQQVALQIAQQAACNEADVVFAPSSRHALVGVVDDGTHGVAQRTVLLRQPCVFSATHKRQIQGSTHQDSNGLGRGAMPRAAERPTRQQGGVVHGICTASTGIQPLCTAATPTSSDAKGAARNGRATAGISASGSPNTSSSLTLKADCVFQRSWTPVGASANVLSFGRLQNAEGFAAALA